MVAFPWTSVALKWNIFFLLGCLACFDEYSPIYLKQLGFSPFQVGITSLFGLPSLFTPLFGFLGDKFRARKLVLVVIIVVFIVLSLLPILPLTIENFQMCREPASNYSESDLQNQTCCPKNSSLSNANSSLNTGLVMVKHLNLSNFLPSLTDSQQDQNAVNRSNVLPASFSLVVFMIAVKATFDMLSGSVVSFWNVAVMTYNKGESVNYGSFYCWGQIGAGVSLFGIGMIASRLKMTICGTVGYGYFVAFAWTAVSMTLSLVGVPWMKYEYLEHRVINWTEVKSVLTDLHYIIVLFIGLYSGVCFSFQYYWEFWYIAELSGSPVVMAMGGLIRRPFGAIWFRLSVNVIEKLGDLKSLALALFIHAVSQFALSFIENPWLVLGIDILQIASHGLSYSALFIHFSKAGSKASSAVMQGLAAESYSFGVGVGSTFTGLMVSSIGTKAILFYYSIATTIILVFYLMYLFGRKNLNDYERVRDCESEESEDNNDQ